ncbi:YceI family protein [Krasilnikoviella flava]|uniref:YceI family protein n=1 Tax=Krasilnikoviella flava TaxID=526729 RepID=UPI001FE99AFB|nr:YceI family protein [Krasilnikoviella flava]
MRRRTKVLVGVGADPALDGGIVTDEPPRDAYFRGSVMQVGTFPAAELAVTDPVRLTAGATEVDLTGELTVHGVTRGVMAEAEDDHGSVELSLHLAPADPECSS